MRHISGGPAEDRRALDWALRQIAWLSTVPPRDGECLRHFLVCLHVHEQADGLPRVGRRGQRGRPWLAVGSARNRRRPQDNIAPRTRQQAETFNTVTP
jgi:hypothetical protein